MTDLVALEANLMAQIKRWEDDNPFFLRLYLLGMPEDESVVLIDLGVSGWMQTFSKYLRTPGVWSLCEKQSRRALLTVLVNPGDQPYYTARHVGVAGSGGTNEITAYGIGKKQANGDMVRLWVMPDGTIVGGEDADQYGVLLLHAIGPRVGRV